MFNAAAFNQKMIKTLDVFDKELSSLRTGRANANMLDLVKVDVYGQKMPINQLGTITTPEPPTALEPPPPPESSQETVPPPLDVRT